MADLFGTYSKRIEITVDHTKIPSDLTWFPLPLFLTNAQMEEIFAELTDDSDFDRIAITTSDEETQLYADVELFDVSEEKAVIFVSKDGWTVSSSVDTTIYIYYDNTVGHNTTYIGKAGIPNFTDWTTEYDGSVEPDSDGWTNSRSTGDWASSDGDILTIDTTGGANTEDMEYYQLAPDVDFDAGVYVKFRMKMHSDSQASGRFFVWIADGTQNERIGFYIYDNSTAYLYNGSWIGGAVFTTTDYHIYELYIKGTTAKAYQDGVLKYSATVQSTSIDDEIGFGDWDDGSNYEIECMIDYVNYALGVGTNPYEDSDYNPHWNVYDSNFKAVYHMNDATTSMILDATSNANHGTKKAANEPVEATGKVGQGQDFDGDDYIELDSQIVSAYPFTLECLAKWSGDASNYTLISLVDKGETNVVYGLRVQSNYPAVNARNTDFKYANASSAYSDDDWHLLTAVFNSNTDKDIYGDDGSNTAQLSDSVTYSAGVDRMSIGRYGDDTPGDYHTGQIDEVRVSDSARSVAWIAATYDSLWDTLLTYGDEEAGGEVKSATGKSSLTTLFVSALSKGATEEATGKSSLTTGFDAVLSKGAITEATGKSNLTTSFEASLGKGKIESVSGKANITTLFVADLSMGITKSATGKSSVSTDFEVTLSKGTIEEAAGKSTIATSFEARMYHSRYIEATGKASLQTNFGAVLGLGKIEITTGQASILSQFEAILDKGRFEEASGKAEIETSFEGRVRRKYKHSQATLGITSNQSTLGITNQAGEWDIIE